MDATVYDLAATVAAGRLGPDAVALRVLEVRGFSARFTSDLAVLDEGQIHGSLLGGLADEQLRAVTGAGEIEVNVGDAEAIAAGLSCGGRARVLAQPLAELPAPLWSTLIDRQPALLLTSMRPDDFGSTRLFAADRVTDADREHPGASRLFAQATSTAELHDDRCLATVFWPQRRLAIVGDGHLADQLRALADRLDWQGWIQADERGLADLVRSDAVVVLTHAHDADVPALAAALSGRAGYVGGLGSRRTQARRRDALHALGFDRLERIHGPAGLDIGAYSPAEIAISIVAEILAHWAGASGGPISARAGAVHA